jgi:hypothetical protein
MELTEKPLLPWPGNGSDFIYTEEATQLSCFIHHIKTPVSNADVATNHAS